MASALRDCTTFSELVIKSSDVLDEGKSGVYPALRNYFTHQSVSSRKGSASSVPGTSFVCNIRYRYSAVSSRTCEPYELSSSRWRYFSPLGIDELGIDEDIQYFSEKHLLPRTANMSWRQLLVQIRISLSTHTLIAPKIRCRFFSLLAFLPVVSQSDINLYGGHSNSVRII